MTSTVWYVFSACSIKRPDIHNPPCRPQEMVDAFKPDFIAPVVGYLSSKGKVASPQICIPLVPKTYFTLDNTETTGSLFEISGGWAAQTRWQRANGHGFPHNKPFTPEDVIAKWKEITTFGIFLQSFFCNKTVGLMLWGQMNTQDILQPAANQWNRLLGTSPTWKLSRPNCSLRNVLDGFSCLILCSIQPPFSWINNDMGSRSVSVSKNSESRELEPGTSGV